MKSFSSALTLFGIGASLLGAGVINGCGGTFEGCEASRSCPEAGKAGAAAGRSSGGRGGSSGGKGGSGGSPGGEAGQESGESGGGGEGGMPATPGEAGQGGAAEGGASATGGTAGAPVVDTTAPEIVSARVERLVAPDGAREETDLDGATGVVADTKIVITFSEPMDRLMTAAAFRFSQFPMRRVTWREDDTGFTLDPGTELEYATGGRGIAALIYELSIVDTAQDLAGNRLAETWSASFRTLRQVTEVLTAEGDVNCRHLLSGANVGCGPATANRTVGDDSANYQQALLMQFDVSGLPRDQLAGVTEATFAATVGGPNGDPLTAFGGLHLYTIDAHPLSTATLVSAATDLGVFLDLNDWGTGPDYSLEILSAFQSGLAASAANENVVQYRLGFPTATDDDSTSDQLIVECTFDLTVGYLIP